MALFKETTKHLQPLGRQIRFYSAPAERSIPPAKQKYVPTSGTYPKGFLAGSSHAGVKASNTKYDDIAMVVSETPCNAGAVFTRNIFKAAPIKHALNTLYERSTSIRGVVVNSGCANAVTGTQGRMDANTMAHATDRCFDPAADKTQSQTLVMSTGVIGQKLPMEKIVSAIPKAHASLGSAHEDWMRAAQAICTTDTFPKLLTRKFRLPSHPTVEYSLAGMTKGAGMIHPNMGTLLGIVCTDVKIDHDAIYGYLRYAADKSFNAISIDGDTSTNDSVVLLANGAAAPQNANAISNSASEDEHGKKRMARFGDLDPDALAFRNVLVAFMTDLAQLVVRDGEGATKFVTITVRSGVSPEQARRVATSIGTSSLVKTALYGKDANWGRILCAMGYTPGIIHNPRMRIGPMSRSDIRTRINLSEISVSFLPADGTEPLKLFTRGEPEDVDEVRAKEILEMEDLEIFVRLEDSKDSGETREGEPNQVYEEKFWTCDFSHEYVTINGDYRT